MNRYTVTDIFEFANEIRNLEIGNGDLCDLCDAGYVGYTRVRVHLHNRVKGHKQQSSAIAKHYKNMHMLKRFEVLKKCRNKFECLVYEMLFIRALKPNLNVQPDSIRAKVFL